MNTRSIATILAVSATLWGCAGMSETERGSAIGAGVGSAAGAGIGAAVGNRRDARKGAIIGAAAGAIGGYIWSNRMEQQRRALQESTQGTGVTVSQTPDNRLRIDVPSDISFDVNQAGIKPNFQPVLDSFASTLRANPVTTVTIVGHTDSTGGPSINLPLSINRAASTRRYLEARGVELGRIAIDGLGARAPVADNSSPAGRALNRRVEIYVAESAPTARVPQRTNPQR